MSIQAPIQGRLTSDPELTFIPSGKALAKFTVVSSRRRKNDAGEWEDVGTTFWDCRAWGPEAEAICESAVKGTEVVIIGEISQRTWETPEGEKRSRMEVEARTFAVVIGRRQTAKVSKVQRDQPAANGFMGSVPGPVDDPWATSSTPASAGAFTPPF